MSRLRQLFNQGLSTSDHVERYARIPYLGSVPNVQAGADPLSRPAAMVAAEPASPFAASVQGLQATLRGAAPRAQVFALTSAVPSDGKTTCSVALARQSALAGARTVLVDCDLRRRCSTAEFGETRTNGLLEVIEGKCPLEAAIFRDQLTTLRVLPVMPDLEAIRRATVQDVFGSREMAALFATLRQEYDYIFVDTPPVELADTRRLTQLVDTMVFLTRWRTTPRRAVALAIDTLKATGVPLAGLVLTRAPPLACRARARPATSGGALVPRVAGWVAAAERARSVGRRLPWTALRRRAQDLG